MSLSALQAGAYLHHLTIESPDPKRLAAFYARVMEMRVHEEAGGSILLLGPQRRLLIRPGHARKFGEAGFAVRDAESLAGLRARAHERGVAIRSGGDPFFASESFAVQDPDRNIVVFGLAKPDEASDWSRSLRGPLQHWTLASRQIEAIEDFYAGRLGFGVSDQVISADGKLMTSFMRGNHEHHNLACFFQDRTGVDHHSYEAGEWDTIRDWCDHFARHDVQLMWGPGRHGPGNNLFVFIVDPDGNWIEVSAELEIIHDRPAKIWRHEERTLNLWGKGILRAAATNE